MIDCDVGFAPDEISEGPCGAQHTVASILTLCAATLKPALSPVRANVDLRASGDSIWELDSAHVFRLDSQLDFESRCDTFLPPPLPGDARLSSFFEKEPLDLLKLPDQ
jgi:hypothetical protein